MSGEQVTPEPKLEGDAKPEVSFLERLTAAKGSKYVEPENLAKAKIHADDHIAKLEAQIAALEASATPAKPGKTQEEILEALIAGLKGVKPTPQGDAAPGAIQEQKPKLAIEAGNQPLDMEAFVTAQMEKILSARAASDTEAQNVASVTQALTGRYGAKTGAVIEQRMKEAKLDIEASRTLMRKQPELFLALFPQAGGKFLPLSGDSGSVVHTPPAADKWQTMRRENPALYARSMKERVAEMAKRLDTSSRSGSQ